MIRTRKGWERATFEKRKEERAILRTLPVVFECDCNQCGCGCIETVIYGSIPRCPACGKVKQNAYGKYYGLEHLKICRSSKYFPVSDEELKAKERLIKQGKYEIRIAR